MKYYLIRDKDTGKFLTTNRINTATPLLYSKAGVNRALAHKEKRFPGRYERVAVTLVVSVE